MIHWSDSELWRVRIELARIVKTNVCGLFGPIEELPSKLRMFIDRSEPYSLKGRLRFGIGNQLSKLMNAIVPRQRS